MTQTTQSQDAAAAVYDTLVRFLRQTTLAVLLTALITVIAGYLDRAVVRQLCAMPRPEVRKPPGMRSPGPG